MDNKHHALDEESLGFGTKAVKHEPIRGPVNTLSTPIYSTSTYILDSAEHGAILSNQMDPGSHSPWLYSRWGNPTNDVASRMIAKLEGAAAAHLTSSGMAAITVALFTFLKAGDQIVAPRPVYSGTHELLLTHLSRFGVDVVFADGRDPVEFAKAITPKTKILYGETPANPTMTLLDIEAFAKLGKERNLITIVDSTFASPYNQNPIKLGIDVVIHSCTKYLGGHSDILTGVIVCSTNEIHHKVYQTLRIFGSAPSPFDGFLLVRGLKTLALRMERHNANGLKVAQFLEAHPKVSQVWYPGLPSHSQHEVAKKQMKGFGGMIAFDVKGGADAGRKLIESVKIINLAVSLGGVESLIEQASTMTHIMVPREERLKAGITDGLIRLSVGVEDVEDLIKDLSNAFDQI